MSDYAWIFVSLAMLALPVLVLGSIHRWGGRAVLLGIVFASFAFTQVNLQLPVDPRGIGLLAMATVALQGAFAGKNKPRLEVSGMTVTALGFILLSALWSQGTTVDTLAQVTFMAGMLLLVSVPFRSHEILTALRVTMAVLAIAAVIVYVTSPADWWEADRLRGPLVNANNLALVCVIGFAALSNIHRLAHFPASAALLGIVTLTGSRAGLLAVGVQVLISSWSRVNAFGRLVMIGITGIAMYYMLPNAIHKLQMGGAGDNSVLRSNNSRELVWAASLERVRTAPWFGTGLGSLTSDFETGSSLFAVWILSGIVGLAVVAVALATALWSAFRTFAMSDWRFLMISGGIINAVFEGWIVAAGTFYALAYWVVVEHVKRSRHHADGIRAAEVNGAQVRRAGSTEWPGMSSVPQV